jgi:hypothetical protein
MHTDVKCKAVCKSSNLPCRNKVKQGNYCGVHMKSCGGDTPTTSKSFSSDFYDAFYSMCCKKCGTFNFNDICNKCPIVDEPAPKSYKIVYSKSKKTVEATNKLDPKDTFSHHINAFVKTFVLPFLKGGVIGKNTLGLTQEQAEFFVTKEAEARSESRKPKDSDLLSKHGISSKEDYKKWCIKNHPDKNGNEPSFVELFQAISVSAKEKFG